MAIDRTSATNAPLLRVAGWSLTLAAIVAVVGMVFLALMYMSFAAGAQPGGEGYGRINDILVVAQYVLMIPAIAAVYVLGRGRWRRESLALAVGGGILVALIVLLQGLLISGAMTFEQQIGPLSIMLLLLAVWFVALGRLVNRLGIARRGVVMGLLAATYVGYPIWAVWLGRALHQQAGAAAPRLAADLPAA